MSLKPRKDEVPGSIAIGLTVYLMVGPPFDFVMNPLLCFVISLLSITLAFGSLVMCASMDFSAGKRAKKYVTRITAIVCIFLIISPSMVVGFIVENDVTPLQRVRFLLSEIFQ